MRRFYNFPSKFCNMVSLVYYLRICAYVAYPHYPIKVFLPFPLSTWVLQISNMETDYMFEIVQGNM